jgi:hypothetical protein
MNTLTKQNAASIGTKRKATVKTGEKNGSLKKNIAASYNKFKELMANNIQACRLGEAINGIMIKANGKKPR